MKLLLSILLCFNTFSSEFKVAFVDIIRIFEVSKTGQDIDQKLEDIARKKEKEMDLEKKETNIFNMKSDFEKRSVLLNENAKEKERKKIENEIFEFQRLNDEIVSFLKEEEIKLKEPVFNKIKETIAKISKEKGMSLVLSRDIKDAILFIPYEELDLTDEVINQIDNKTK